MRLSSKYILILAIALISLLNACKSTRYGIVKKTFHNVTAHYNGYFNAKQRIDNSEIQSDKAFKDKYDELLPVFKLEREDDPLAKTGKTSNQALDDAIKKASLVIQRHEKSKWIDDCYFEMGRSYFYKKDYFTAAETFQFTAGKYKGAMVGDVSYIWLIKSYLMLKKYNQAESVINVALASETFPKRNVSELFAVIAWYHIDRKNYVKAIEYLEKSISVERKKSLRARYSYICAQLYEIIQDEEKASLRYQQVLKLSPPYELAFNAKINSAKLVQVNSKNSKKSLEKELLKMLTDVKNKEYLDQIYYSLALIYEKNEQQEKCINALRSSAASSISNLPQKGKSYFKLANILYDEEKYESAQIYYDSASTFLSKTNADFELANKRKISLSKLVENLRIINREDSLLRIARMPEKERLLYVNDLIRKEKEEKLRKEEEEKRLAALAISNTATMNENGGLQKPGSTSSGSTWYFYNQNSLGVGASDFVKKFGRRTLEDNWRRSNKESFASVSAIANGEDGGNESNNTANLKNDDESVRKRYLANIPTTPAATTASIDKIVRAFYNIGQFYREEIMNPTESIKAYQTCIVRFPDNKLKAEIYFQLYRIYNQQNNKAQSDLYKNKLLSEFPNSLMAKVILDPDYVSDSKANDKAAQTFYNNLYDAYLNLNYAVVLSAKAAIDTQYAQTSIASKYYYLYALCMNKTAGVKDFEIALNNLINKYPSSDAASTAREHLQKIAEMKNPELAKVNTEETVLFELDPRAKYYVMISLDVSSTRETKLNLFRFNNTEFSLNKLQINSDLIGENEQTLYISPFQDVNAAKEYISALNKKINEVVKLKAGTYFISFISEKNYKLMKDKKAIKQYLQFYNANYLINE